MKKIKATDQPIEIAVGESTEVKIGFSQAFSRLWIARGLDWVPTVRHGPGKLLYPQVTYIGDHKIVLPPHVTLGMWMKGERTPRSQGYVLYGSGRYKEWQNLAYEILHMNNGIGLVMNGSNLQRTLLTISNRYG